MLSSCQSRPNYKTLLTMESKREIKEASEHN